MSERPTRIIRLARDETIATIVLDDPQQLNAWS